MSNYDILQVCRLAKLHSEFYLFLNYFGYKVVIII